MSIEPAEAAFDAGGTPFSPRYDDVYHSASGGPAQARHVFLGGNALPARWAHAESFVILETGFGLGINFLTTWQAWREDAARPRRLHYVAIEKHPFTSADLARLHAGYPELAPHTAELRAGWPPLTAGLHRLRLAGGAVVLTLAFGDIAQLLPSLRLAADAIYLDGFSPAKNPQMWAPPLLKRLARLARPQATLATYTSAGEVRRALEAAGFAVDKRAGFGRKREMLAARYAPRWSLRHPPLVATPAPQRHALVIGGGIAGAAIAARLAGRGWRIDLVEQRDPRAFAAGARLAGVFHPHVSHDDCVLSRAARNACLHALAQWSRLEAAGHRFAWARCGVLQIDEAGGWTPASAAATGLPADYAEFVDRARASQLAGCAVTAGGWWFASGGWLRPLELIDAQLAAARDEAAGFAAHYGRAVARLARVDGGWQAHDAAGACIAAAPVAVLANALDAPRLAPVAESLRSIRGQISYLPAAALAAPRCVVAGKGYLLPAVDGTVVTGATYDFDDDNPAPHADSHRANLLRLGKLLADPPQGLDAQALDGAAGFRCVATDRMPLIGALPDLDAARARRDELGGAHLADLPRLPGLYCATAYASRGLIWSELGAEAIADLLEGDPLAVEGELADAVDPARFALKQLRRGRL